jgi:hypothetical protein
MTAQAQAAVDPATQAPRPASYLAWVMPPATDIIFLVLFVSLAFGGLAPRLLGDADAGWHIRNGELILSSRSVPHADPFSYTLAGQPWYAWEWLYDAAAGAIHRAAGLNGVVLLGAALISLTFALLFRWTLARGRRLLPVALFVVLSMMASSIHFLARPHLASWLLVLLFWHVLDGYAAGQPGRVRTLALLPLLMVLWVNVHGGFLLGLALTWIYLAGAAWDGLFAPDAEGRSQARRRAGRLGATWLASAAATLVNPYGWALWQHIWRYLTNRYLMDHIQEFLSPNFHGAAEKSFAFILLATLGTLACNRRKISAATLLTILLAVYMGLYAARNIPIAAILLTVTVAPLLGASLQGKAHSQQPYRWQRLLARVDSFSAHMADMDLRLAGKVWPALAIALGLWIAVHGGRLGARRVMAAEFDPAKFPAGATSFLASHRIRQQVFNPDSWGGHLIYRLYPEYRVFMDDRHDFYGEQFVKDYVKVRGVEPGWQEILERWRVNWVLIKPGSTLANALKQMPGWRLAYEDKTATLFERVAPLSGASAYPR